MMTIAYQTKDQSKATPVGAPPISSKPIAIDLASVRLDGGTQSRAGLNDETTADYAEAIAAGAKFPAVTVFYDGQSYWLADGFHRHAAHVQAGKKKILADVRQGIRRDAILHSVGANEAHGLRRTREDKRKAVMTLLEDSEWSTWPNTKVAVKCGVSESYVRHLRLNEDIETQSVRTITRGGATYSMKTAAIGAKTGGDENKEIFREPIAAQGIESGDQPKKAAEEVTAPAKPALHSDDPFDTPSDPVIVGPITQPAPFDAEPDDASEVTSIQADQPTDSAAGNQYIRGLVHLKIRGFDTFCKEHKPEFVAEGVRPDEVASMRHLAGRINKWMEAFLAAAKRESVA